MQVFVILLWLTILVRAETDEYEEFKYVQDKEIDDEWSLSFKVVIFIWILCIAFIASLLVFQSMRKEEGDPSGTKKSMPLPVKIEKPLSDPSRKGDGTLVSALNQLFIKLIPSKAAVTAEQKPVSNLPSSEKGKKNELQPSPPEALVPQPSAPPKTSVFRKLLGLTPPKAIESPKPTQQVRPTQNTRHEAAPRATAKASQICISKSNPQQRKQAAARDRRAAARAAVAAAQARPVPRGPPPPLRLRPRPPPQAPRRRLLPVRHPRPHGRRPAHPRRRARLRRLRQRPRRHLPARAPRRRAHGRGGARRARGGAGPAGPAGTVRAPPAAGGAPRSKLSGPHNYWSNRGQIDHPFRALSPPSCPWLCRLYVAADM